MEDRIKKLEELVGTLAAWLSELNTGQKDLFARITERAAKLSQQVSGKSQGEVGENSNNIFRGRIDQHSQDHFAQNEFPRLLLVLNNPCHIRPCLTFFKNSFLGLSSPNY